ncbi:NB-ARC domain-containing protein [Streptomyces sp. NPDC006482]|uniref:NB-ARC domain-containing protein n=1 Tax=Streptomyces sp. NPDC006482 TaxID=3154306 RepID=UPI0033BDFBB2
MTAPIALTAPGAPVVPTASAAPGAPAAPATPDSLAEALFGAREAACLTQEELAEVSGLSVRAIRNLETGRTARPRKQSLLLLAEALGLPPEEAGRLLTLPHDRNPAGPPGDPCVPAELPAAPTQRLVGRETLVLALRTFLVEGDAHRGRLAVVVGAPGAGKTSLVSRTAHLVRDHFPDGQVHVDLAAHRPPSTVPAPGPLTPDAIVRRVLRSLGCAPEQEYGEERGEEAGARLRDVLSRRRVLVVLDNVDSEAQVRPLLGGGASSAVLVAARRELSALPGGFAVSVGTLAQPDAYQLLEDLVGADRTSAERSAALSITQSCAGLPLALHLAGLWLTSRPHRPLRDLADRLVYEQDRLRLLRIGDLSLPASVSACHRLLRPAERALLRKLGAARGDFGLDDVLARSALSRDVATDLLEELLHRQMIHLSRTGRTGQIRYRLYDAVRLYVSHCAVPDPRSVTAGETSLSQELMVS